MNRELVALAHQVIDGIPEAVINLHAYRDRKGKSLDCGTICCGAGWLAVNPQFNELGLTASPEGWPLFNFSDSNYALDKLFGVGAYDAMFATKQWGTNDESIFQVKGRNISDKELILHRMKIVYHGLDKWKKMQEAK